MIKYWYFTLILFLMLSSITTAQSYSQRFKSDFIKEDSMNLAILELDFLTYEFIEGNMAYFPLCDSCDSDSLPFNIEFMSPMDYGEILFKYSHNEDTLFYASIWWMGTGEIYYPDQFLPSSVFAYQNESIILPDHAQYYEYLLIPTYYSLDQYKQKADSAWMSIDSLQIVNEFAEYTFRVGLYAYTPTVGEFDPYVAKWIIFLYYGNTFTTKISDIVQETSIIKSYPNPFTTSTTIEYELTELSRVQLTIYNAIGDEVYKAEDRMMPQGKHSFVWNAEGLPEGLYYAVLRSGDGVSVVKIVKQ